jgi:hypothetical protein
MTRFGFTLLLLCLLATQIQAQVIGEKETLRRIYEQTTILPMGNGFVKNGVVAKNKPFESALRAELKQTPEAFSRFKKSRLQTFGYAGMMTVGLMMNDFSAFSFQYLNDPKDRTVALSTFIVGQIVLISSSNQLNKAANNLQNAIWLHNRSQILKEASKNAALDVSKLAEQYDRNTIQFTTSGFYQNGRYQTFGFLNKNLDKLMHTNPLAMGQLKKAKVNKIVALGLNVAGLALMMYSPLTNSGKTSIYGNGWFWGGYGCGLAAGFAGVQSANQMAKAAWYYNRDAFAGH